MNGDAFLFLRKTIAKPGAGPGKYSGFGNLKSAFGIAKNAAK